MGTDLTQGMRDDIYLLEHWKFNADQRLKTFNFFVAFSIFANGGLFTAFDRCVHPVLLFLLGGFVAILSLTFMVVDSRCRRLLRLTKAGLAVQEAGRPPHARLFTNDRHTSGRLVRFTVAFNALFALQCLFGLMVVAYAGSTMAAGAWGLGAWMFLQPHCR